LKELKKLKEFKRFAATVQDFAPFQLHASAVTRVCHLCHLILPNCTRLIKLRGATLLTAIFCLIGDPHLIGGLCSLVTATLFLIVLLMMGMLCSLTARSAASALAITFMLPIVMLIGTVLMSVAVEEGAGPVIWVIGGLFLLATRWWTRRSVSTVAAGCHFIAVHLAFTALASCWTYDGRRAEFPVLAIISIVRGHPFPDGAARFKSQIVRR
jgi:hypothetical protein